MTRRRGKWTGLCKFSFYLEFTALQCIPVLLFKRESTSTSLCACLGYEHHYSFCVFGDAVQMKSAELKQISPYQLYTSGVACREMTWPNDLQTSRSLYTGIPLDRLHWNHTGWCYRPLVFQWQSNVNLHNWNTLENRLSHKYKIAFYMRDYSGYSNMHLLKWQMHQSSKSTSWPWANHILHDLIHFLSIYCISMVEDKFVNISIMWSLIFYSHNQVHMHVWDIQFHYINKVNYRTFRHHTIQILAYIISVQMENAGNSMDLWNLEICV